jgi:hypothetical protein
VALSVLLLLPLALQALLQLLLAGFAAPPHFQLLWRGTRKLSKPLLSQSASPSPSAPNARKLPWLS